MLPLYVPGAKPAEFTVTVIALTGVVLVAPALVDSQEPVTATVNGIPAGAEALVTLKVWDAGLVPCWEVNVSEVGATVTFPVLPPVPPLTVKVTGRVWITPLTLK